YVLLTICAVVAGAVLSGISQLFRLSTPLTVDNFWSQFQFFAKAFWQHPFDYTIGLYFKDPIHSIVGLILITILVILAVFWRRTRRRIEMLAADLKEASVAQALVNQLGIGGRWPNTEGNDSPWTDICKEIQRADNMVLCILGANGIETFGERGSPLYEIIQTFTGTVRVILLHPASREMSGRAQSVGTDIRVYKKAIMTSQARLRDLRRQHRAVDGRFYTG